LHKEAAVITTKLNTEKSKSCIWIHKKHTYAKV